VRAFDAVIIDDDPDAPPGEMIPDAFQVADPGKMPLRAVEGVCGSGHGGSSGFACWSSLFRRFR
jgi:hypothetical protein